MKKINPLARYILMLTSCIATNASAAIVINEIDYDQPGTDNAEFIELFNTGSSAFSLDNYYLALINGSNASSYRSINLSGFSISGNGFFVVCGDSSLVANCDYSFTTTSGWFQNGAPDAVALYEDSDLLDSLSYEGSIAPYTEGEAIIVKDNRTEILSLSRIIDGMDSNNNLLDFELGCITPGSSNIAGSGNCSVTGVSAVPVPAASWLFGSGLIALAGLTRRK